MLTYKRRYLNLIPPDPDTDNQEEGRAWTFLDNLFGATDQAADIYNKIRMEQIYGPMPPGGYPASQPNPNTTALIIGGSVVAVIALVLIIKK